MYTLGIPDRQKRRTLGYLKQRYVDQNSSINPLLLIQLPDKKAQNEDIKDDILNISINDI